MTEVTNKLVNGVKEMTKKPLSLGAGALLTTALAVSLVFHESSMKAASTTAPVDDSSVAALTALDRAMEAVTAHVQPAVVNVRVTSHGSEEETSQQGGAAANSSRASAVLRSEWAIRRVAKAGRRQGQGQGRRFQQQQQPLEHGVGSGIIISPDGFIVTNNHVVDGAVIGEGDAERPAGAEREGDRTDKLTDLAVIKIDGHDLPYLQWGDSSTLKPGQTVLAFGSPFGIASRTR